MHSAFGGRQCPVADAKPLHQLGYRRAKIAAAAHQSARLHWQRRHQIEPFLVVKPGCADCRFGDWRGIAREQRHQPCAAQPQAGLIDHGGTFGRGQFSAQFAEPGKTGFDLR